jgi:hypothetical protein
MGTDEIRVDSAISDASQLLPPQTIREWNEVLAP